MSVRGLCTLVALTFLAAAVAAADTVRPQVACDATGHCAVSQLPAIVADRDVRSYLQSGLTTSLVLTFTAKDRAGTRRQAAARVDVRYEPWEETFEVWVAVTGSAPRKDSIAPARLASWWSDLRVSFVLDGPAVGSARVDVDLIPFSEEEEADTRRWYAEALRGGGLQRSSVDGGAIAAVPMLDALTLTSIKRHGVLRFSWSAPVQGVP
jgi:hypothetical protein